MTHATSPSRNGAGLVLATLVLYALHQDFWFWGQARPLVFGFLPVGLAYHAAYCVVSSLLMWRLVLRAWPQHLEDEAEAASSHSKNPA
jgi:hypothetical protein